MAPQSQASALASRPLAGHYAGSWQGKGITTLGCLSPTIHAVGQRTTDPHRQVEDAQKQTGLPEAHCASGFLSEPFQRRP